MRAMEVTVKKKGGPPMDEDSLVEDAIREVAGRIDKFDSDSLSGAYREKMAPPMGAQEEVADGEAPAMSKEDCPDCAAGECAEPEHMDEETLRAMLASMSDEGRG
jgi:hypothetical protein